MLAYDVILKKRDGRQLTGEQLEYIVGGYVRGDIPDYQMAAFLMAVFFRGMTDRETSELTMLMARSGEMVDLSSIPGVKVDKHSTGGVGDTTTLILAPLVASAGLPVAKMSGRGLGHTGGTLDKMESIPGMTVSLTKKEFTDQVNRIGIAVIGQTADLVPADRKMYALRDITATIDSIPLIAASIMSKKIASGTDAILLDVKTGNGAFMKDIKDARKLAELMVSIGNSVGRKTAALITDMSQPLGTHIGNALEVKEAVEILRGDHRGTPLWDVSLSLGAYLLFMGGAAVSPEEGRAKMEVLLESGKGAEKLEQLIEAQKGEPRVVQNLSLLPQAGHQLEILSRKSGFVTGFDTEGVGHCALLLGAGRRKKTDPVDPAVGLVLKKRLGDKVERNEPLATIYANDSSRAREASEYFTRSITIDSSEPEPIKLIHDTIPPTS